MNNLKSLFPQISKRKDALLFLIFFMSGLTLIGWLFNNPTLTSFSMQYKPNSPIVGGFFIVLSSLLLINIYFEKSRLAKIIVTSLIIIITLFCGEILLEYLLKFPLNIENALVKNLDRYGVTLTGHMSPITSLLLIFICISISSIRKNNIDAIKYFGASLSLFVCFISFVLLINYLLNATLLYGNKIIPVALPASICFFSFSITLLRVCEFKYWTFNLIKENKITYLLLKSFLPIVIAIVIIMGYLDSTIPASDINPSFKSAIILLIIVSITILIIIRISTNIGTMLLKGEQVLKESEEQLTRLNYYSRSLLEASLDPLVTISADGKITDANLAAEHATGILRDSLKGTDFSDYFTEPEKARIGYKKVFTDGNVIDYPLTIRHTSNKLIDVLYNASVYHNEQGEILGVFAAARDITLRKQAEQKQKESEEKLQNSYYYARSLLEASLDPLVTISADGKITDANLAAEHATGILRDSLKGTDFSDYFTEPEKARIGYKKVFTDGNVIDYPLTIRQTSNKLIDVLYNASVYRNEQGEIIGVFAAARDITELTLVQKNLKKRIDELNMVIKENKELGAFTYSVSHDLRAPLRHINGYVELLLERFYDSLPEQAQHYLKTVADSSRQMSTLIDDLLQFSRIGRQEKQLVTFDMNIIVQEVIASIIQDNQKRNIEWRIATLPNIHGDKAMLLLVWMNLLSNAAKFTRTREKAIIEINVHDENDVFIFSIQDNGVGFDMQYVQKLFGVFQRLHSADAFEGTGIGLANVQRIILMHGGRIWAEAELDKGATFYFSLPKNKED